MKKILIAVFMVLVMVGMANAEANWRDTCRDLGGLAEVIMDSRQMGVPMARLMAVISDEGGSQLTESLIIDAYSVPRFRTEKMQKQAVADFREKVYLECVIALR